jgi:hypothetical protein
MIFVVTPSPETWEFEDYLHGYGMELSGRIRILTYDEIVARGEVPLGSYIFVALDQLTATEKEIAVQCCHELSKASSEVTLINHPSEVLLRYDFLKACFDRKRNSFRACRAFEFLSCGNFPVFLRSGLNHNGSLTELLYTQRELAVAVAKSLRRGYRLRDLIVVEYCDTRGPTGIFRKYSAFIVKDKILPHTLIHGTNWITKSHGRLIDADTAREELEYVQNNPHAKWLRETFELAKIHYGRIDYGLRDGEPQVWEINTNPTIIRRPGGDSISEEQRRLRDPVRKQFFPNFQVALAAIDSRADPSEIARIDVSPRQRRNLEIEKQMRLRVQARKTFVSQSAGLLVRSLRYLRSL